MKAGKGDVWRRGREEGRNEGKEREGEERRGGEGGRVGG